MRIDAMVVAALAVVAMAGGLHGEALGFKPADGAKPSPAGKVLRASEFGWTGTDDTAAIQKALDSDAQKVIIDRQAGDWVVRPLFVRRGNVEIVLEDGVTVRAKKGAFHALNDCLVRITGAATNVLLRGEGKARLVMNKADYLDRSQYEFSEWRMGISAHGTDVTVRNLEVLASGGDGVYVNGAYNLLLEDLDCRDHDRQGLSIIQVSGLTVRNCRFVSTSGAPPMAGLDYEPNHERNYCENVLFERCDFSNNDASGVIFCLPNFTSKSRPVSIVMRDCTMLNNKHHGISFIGCKGTNAVTGTVTLERCRMAGNGLEAFSLRAHIGAIDLKLKDCVIDARDTGRTALSMSNGGLMADMRRIAFDNVRILVGRERAYDFSAMTGVGLADITGALDVEGPDGKSRITAEELMRRHPPRPELRTFTSSTPDWRALKPAVPFRRLDKPVATPFFRYRQTFVQYVPGPGEYPVVFRVRMHGMYHDKPEARVKVYTPGADIGEFVIDQAKQTYVIRPAADKSNFYIFDVKLAHSGTVSVESAWPGSGTLAQTGLAVSGVGKQELYHFYVGEGVEGVQVKMSPANGEPASAVLRDPSGQIVAEQPYVDSGTILRSAKGAPAPVGVWTVQFPKVHDDCAVFVGGDAVPIMSFSPETVLVK